MKYGMNKSYARILDTRVWLKSHGVIDEVDDVVIAVIEVSGGQSAFKLNTLLCWGLVRLIMFYYIIIWHKLSLCSIYIYYKISVRECYQFTRGRLHSL